MKPLIGKRVRLNDDYLNEASGLKYFHIRPWLRSASTNSQKSALFGLESPLFSGTSSQVELDLQITADSKLILQYIAPSPNPRP